MLFSSGYYQSRYPRVNQHTLSVIYRTLNEQPQQNTKRLLDYGCGEGRYIFHCLSHSSAPTIGAYDIASAPLQRLANKLNSDENTRVNIIHGSHALQQYNETVGDRTHDVVLLLFGVLSHISTKSERQTLLRFLSRQLQTEHGQLILSVPNKKRRFRYLQHKHRKGDEQSNIHYSRKVNNTTIPLTYHLYDVASLTHELTQAGLTIVSMQAESIFPEIWITRHTIIGWIDKYLTKLLPASWGYGLLVCCRTTHR